MFRGDFQGGHGPSGPYGQAAPVAQLFHKDDLLLQHSSSDFFTGNILQGERVNERGQTNGCRSKDEIGKTYKKRIAMLSESQMSS